MCINVVKVMEKNSMRLTADPNVQLPSQCKWGICEGMCRWRHACVSMGCQLRCRDAPEHYNVLTYRAVEVTLVKPDSQPS